MKEKRTISTVKTITQPHRIKKRNKRNWTWKKFYLIFHPVLIKSFYVYKQITQEQNNITAHIHSIKSSTYENEI